MLVKIADEKYESATGNVFTYQEIKNAIYREQKRGFKLKDTPFNNVVCIKFNYNTWEIELLDKYYVVIGEFTKKRFTNEENAQDWANRMRYLHGVECEVHVITDKNFNLEEELYLEHVERTLAKRREC